MKNIEKVFFFEFSKISRLLCQIEKAFNFWKLIESGSKLGYFSWKNTKLVKIIGYIFYWSKILLENSKKYLKYTARKKWVYKTILPIEPSLLIEWNKIWINQPEFMSYRIGVIIM